MVDFMKFHKNEDLFKQPVRAAADHFKTRDVFIEKDYWVTYALKNLFTSELAERTVFKGGTSLSNWNQPLSGMKNKVRVWGKNIQL